MWATRPHLANIFEKLLDQKTFICLRLGNCSRHGKTAYFASINSAKFKRKVVPGDILTLETEIIKVKGPIGVGKATAKVGDEIACIAELTFAVE